MWRTELGKKPGRIVIIFFVATLAALLMATPLMSLVTAGDANASMGGKTAVIEEDLKTIVAEDTSIPSQIQGINPALKSAFRPSRIELEVEPVQDVELGDLRPSNYANNPLGEERPSPTGTSDPEPMDAPFLANDVLVYNDAANSEKNVSLAKTSNGTLYVAYDHDIGTGLRDVYVSKSSDGGLTWAKRDIAVDATEDESCPSIAGDYSPTSASDMLYVWYNNPTPEYARSQDGDTWNLVDFDGGITWWDYVNCPYVDVRGDFMVVVSEYYDTNKNIDTWRILYTIDGSSWTTYYFNMRAGAWVYQPRVSIQSVDAGAGEGDVVVTMTIHDRSNPNPAIWFYDAVLTDATLTGDLGTDSWGIFLYMSPVPNLDPVAPDVAANDREVIFVMSVYNPGVLPLNTMYTYCLWAPDVDDIGSATWNGCGGTGFLAIDPSDVKDQKYTKLYREGTAVHAVWLNGTDINYMFSPNGGANWIGPPMKVNDPSSNTALDEWHSPDVISWDGKAGVAWHDSRGSDNVYFQTFDNSRWYEIRADPAEPNLGVREVGDSWHPSSYYYLWADASVHDVEATGVYEIPTNTRYTFNQWDDGSPLNPTTVTVSSGDYNITAIYDIEFYLMLNGGPGTITPVSDYQPAYTWVTIETFPPAEPPGGRYLFMGWTGDVNNNTNPCIDCVYMDGPKTIWANWTLQWNVTIFTDPVPLTIQVNGFDHTAPYTTWFNDSEVYIINASSPQNIGPTMRYAWTHWSDAGLQSHGVSVTTPGTNFTAFYMVEFNVTVDTNPTGLQVRINMVDYTAPYPLWCPEFALPFLEAPSPQNLGVPGERYIWRDWSDGGAQLHQHMCVGPETVIANYTFQRRVTVDTLPSGFGVIVDGQVYTTPVQFWWDDGSAHTLEAYEYILVSPNERYQFINWSDAGARNHTYWANKSLDTVTVYYSLKQYKIEFQANHTGLTIDLNGSPIALPYVFWCDDNSVHALSAPAIQQFGDTRYVFESWSDGGSQTHFFTCFAPDIITVNYAKEYRAFINSTLDGNPATLNVIVGGTTYSTPVEVWWPSDTTMALDTVEFQPEQDPVSGVRYRFVDWDDSVIKARNIVVNAPGLAYVANFVTQFKLTFVDPYGTPMTTPVGWPVTDGIYFDSGTVVQISTDDAVPDTANHRWRFDGWSSADPNGYTGPNNPATITMNNPITQTASWIDQYLLTIVSSYGTPAASGWFDQHATVPYAYWYDMGDIATFWVDNEVIISADEKVVFDIWVGGTNGTVMNAGLTVTAVWDLYYMVTIITPHGTPPASDWVIEDGSFFLDIEEYVRVGDSRNYFTGWTTSDTANGGYQGTTRQVVLTVTGPITETATWKTQHLLTIVTDYGTPTASGWEDQENATAFWYAEGDVAAFWMEAEVFISTENDAKAIFEQWSGATNGTTMNSPVEVTAIWHLEYLVTIESEFGTVPPDTWVRDGQTYQITMNETVYEIVDETRHVFVSWSTDDTDNGGYQGTDRETVLTVTGPIEQTANWVTQYYIRIVSTYGEEPDTLGDPKGEGWHNESSVATVEVAGSETKDGWVYKFENWVGEVDDHISNKTTLTVDRPMLLRAVWSKSEKTQPLSILTWLAIVIVVIAVVVVTALLLTKRKRSIEAEAPQTDEEESPTEETPDEIEPGAENEDLQ